MDAVAAESTDVSWPALPDEAPLEMPAQSIRHRPKPHSGRGRLPSAPRGMALRRLLVIGGAVLMTAVAANEMYKVLTAGTLTVLAALVLVLFVALFAWIALAFTSAASGFVCLLAGGIPPRHLDKGASPRSRNAELVWRDLMSASVARLNERAGKKNR